MSARRSGFTNTLKPCTNNQEKNDEKMSEKKELVGEAGRELQWFLRVKG